MNDVELSHLIKMLNQVTENLTQGDEDQVAAERVANHIRRFWAPVMKERIKAYAEGDSDELLPVAKLALAEI